MTDVSQDAAIPVEFYQWLYTIERDVCVWDLTPNEIKDLLARFEVHIRSTIAARDTGNMVEYVGHPELGTPDPAARDTEAMRQIPREPTPEMLMAGRKQTFADMTGAHCGPSAENTWKAMYDAALTSAAQDGVS